MQNNIIDTHTNGFVCRETVSKILGLNELAPLSIKGMADNLKVTFRQLNPISDSLNNFYDNLRLSFEELGVQTLDFEDALDDNKKVRPNIAVFVAGMNDDAKDMMVNHVSSLYKNPIIGLYEGACPANPEDSNQDKLSSIISVLAYDVVHIAIFTNEQAWTICTMNGAIISIPYNQNLTNNIFNLLVPKLTAQVVPPSILTDILYRTEIFDPRQPEFTPIIEDLTSAALILKEDGLIMSHTKVSSLKFKNKFHERVIKAFLDQRSGMSYGFMVWQLPVQSKPAVLVNSNDIEDFYPNKNYIKVSFRGKQYRIEIPDVWVISTRSGCDKTNLDISKDIVRMGLSNGEVILDLPIGSTKEQDVKPSYDTLAILAHALGNSILSSLLKTINGDNLFSQALDTKGASLFHWHGYLEKDQVPLNHFIHGDENPSVSCSTRQSALYSFLGKLDALNESTLQNTGFLGDVHVEQHHGTNISSIKSLTEVVTYLHSILNTN